MNEKDVLLLAASTYDFTDETTGKQVRGQTVHLIVLDEKSDYINGNKPIKYSLPVEFASDLHSTELPALAKMTFEFDFARNKVIPEHFRELQPLSDFLSVVKS